MKICASKPIYLTAGDWDSKAKGTKDGDYSFTPKIVKAGTPLDLPVEKNQNCQKFVGGLMSEGLLFKYEGKKKALEPEPPKEEVTEEETDEK